MCWPDRQADAPSLRACFGLLALAAIGLTLAGWCDRRVMKLQPCPCAFFSACSIC
jgi:hypothetical protein